MKTVTEMMREFFRAVGDAEGDREKVGLYVSQRTWTRRLMLMAEEWDELMEAWRDADPGMSSDTDGPSSSDMAHLAKEMADVVYVVVGSAIALGIDFDAVFREVHESNMRKANGPRRADGKILKPEGWQPPDILGVLARQRRAPSEREFDTTDVEDDGDITVHPAVKP